MKYYIYAVICIVAIAIVSGFFVIGSPKEERMLRLDARRIQDLQFLQSEIINYWQSKNQLPGDLSALADDIRGITIPKDPETGADYVYQVKGELKFALCANFARPSSNSINPRGASVPVEPPYIGIQNWEHGAGNICFDRTIDKDLYKKPVSK